MRLGQSFRIGALSFAVLFAVAHAGEPQVIDARAQFTGGTWRFDVTVRHADTGWEHYADAWRVVGPDGTVYGTRTLYHPHVEEQPFTRSLSGVRIPADVSSVRVESRDSVHGWGATTVTVQLER
ncbi:MAG: hypothetical protein ACFB03_16335 [Paracoccaceae bacterium]